MPFSNGGRGVIPYAIKRITTAKGKVLYERSGTGPGQVVDPTYVGMMNSMLSQTVVDGTGTQGAHRRLAGGRQDRHSQDFRDAWFIGYTGALTAGVWFGNDDNKPTKHATGGSLPAIAWQRFMSAALHGQAVADLPGNYRFGDPANQRYAGRPLYPSDMTRQQADGAPMVLSPGSGNTGPVATGPDMPQGGWIDRPAGRPVPPGAVGQRRREGPITGLLQQLFGG